MNINSSPYSHSKIFFHKNILDNIANGIHCIPIYIRIKPTNKCNHNCDYCHYKNPYLNLDEYNPLDEIPKDKMLETIDCLGNMGVKAVTFSGGGEPLLYPYIEETMNRVIENGIDLSIITNGSLLKGTKAELLSHSSWVRISVESCNDEEYCKVRGIKKGSFDELCGNIENFSRIKNNACELGINVVIGKDNYDEIEKMSRLMKSLGVNHVKFAPLCSNNTREYHKSFMRDVIKAINKVQKELCDDRFRIIDLYSSDFEKAILFNRSYINCPIKEMVCVIAANSKVYYCHDKAYLSDGVVCDISNQTFEEGWNSPEVISIFKDFNAQNICKQHCVYDSRNELINKYFENGMPNLDLSEEPEHINFI